jgi:uncharacterized protein (DUF2141 family)
MTMPACTRRWALAFPLLALPATCQAARLDVELTGVENGQGLVRVAVCTPETFATKHCPFSGAAPARPESVVVSVNGIPPGRYAVQAYHDEDGNGHLRRGLFGIPSEAIGFSRDARVTLSAPPFEDAAIEVAEPATATRFRLHHVGP